MGPNSYLLVMNGTTKDAEVHRLKDGKLIFEFLIILISEIKIIILLLGTELHCFCE